MARFGEFKAQFYSRSNLNTPLADTAGSSARVPLRGSTTAFKNGDGRTELVFGYDDKLSQLIVEGRIVTCYQYDEVADPPYMGGIPFCLPFIIEKVTPAGPGLLRIEGPDLLAELKNLQAYSPIGAGTTTNSTVAVEAVPDPWFTTVGIAAPVNNSSITLAASSGIEPGDEVRIEMADGAGTHVTVANTVNPDGAPHDHTLQIRDRMPWHALIGNDVERRRRKVQVATGQGGAFQVGVECRLTLDNNSVHVTIIEEEPEEDIITMRDGAPDGAAIGKAIQAKDFNQPTTSDVTTLMNYMAGWGVEFDSGGYTGTAAGTHHAPHGESIFDLLVATAKMTGEFFRLKTPGITTVPERKVQWKRGADYAGSGGNLRLVQPAQADVDNEALNVNRAIITGDPEREGIWQPVTRVVPFAGDKRITLKLCSESARLQAQVEGLTLVDTGLGLYQPPYLVNTTAESALGQVVGRAVTFSQIRVETDSATEFQSAADALMRASIAFLYEHGAGVRYRYTVPGIISPIPVQPGQRVEMVYTSPDGRWSVNRTGVNALYVLEVRAEFTDAQDTVDGSVLAGMNMVTLVLVESPWDIPDVEGATAAAVAEVARIGRQGTGGGGDGGATTVVVSGGAASDHGALTGLADDDHPQYLRADGTRQLTGNLAAATGVTVDGVDLSAHAADANAHHAAVTASNSGISLSGQSVGVALASPSAIEISGGLRLNAIVGGNGLILDNQSLSVDLFGDSGLAFNVGKLTLGTPGAVSVSSVGSVSGSGHTHAVTASDNPGAAAALLKTSAAGQLQLYGLGVGIAPDALSGLKVQSPTANRYGLFLKQRADQNAPLLRAEAADGSALVILTTGGDLESGNPGFVSGLRGWQIAPDGSAEFNNVRVRGELHATVFVADEMHATGGTLMVATATTIAPVGSDASYDNILDPVDSAGQTKIVVNRSWATGLSYFAVGDVIRIKPMGETQSGGSLYLPDIYLVVTQVTSNGDRNLGQGNPGTSKLACTRRSGGHTGFVIPDGAAVVLWTKTGGAAGSYKGNLLLTADMAQSPYLDVFTVDASLSAAAVWPGSGELRTPPALKPRVRVGNLDGVLGLTEQWGIAAGTDLSDSSTLSRYLVASDKQVRLNNVDLSVYNAGLQVIKLNSGADGTDPSIALGYPILPSGLTTGGAGFWVSHDEDTNNIHFRVGGAAGPALRWDGYNLSIHNSAGDSVIRADANGLSYFAGPMTLGGSGGIWQGSGTFDAPTTGLKLYRSGSMGVLASFNGGRVQAQFDTDGKFKTGHDGATWGVVMGQDGLTLDAPNTADVDTLIANVTKRVNWKYGSTVVGWAGGRNVSGMNYYGVELMASPQVGIRLMHSANGIAESRLFTNGHLALAAGAGRQVHVGSDMWLASNDLAYAASLGLTPQTADVAAGATNCPVYVKVVNGVQKLYVRFSNGVIRELASA